MVITDRLQRQALVDAIRSAVDHGDGPRVAELLDLLEFVADAELLDRVEEAVARPPALPGQRRR